MLRNLGIMKKMIQWVLAATLICGGSVFTSCTSDNGDNPVQAQQQIAIIAKNGTIEYWQQIRSAFESECADKGVEALCYFTSSDFDYEEQRKAVSRLAAEAGSGLRGGGFQVLHHRGRRRQGIQYQ